MLDIADVSFTRRALSAPLVATIGGAVVVLCSVVSLLGWLLASPALTSFGITGSPIWPPTAAGFLFLTIAMAAAIRGRIRTAALLGSVPLTIAVYSGFEALTNRSFGVDRLLLDDRLSHIAASPFPGRVGLSPSAVFVTLLIAGALALHRGGRLRTIAMLISSFALWLGLAATLLVLFATPDDAIFRLFVTSLPGGLCMIFIGVAFVAWTGDFAWVGTRAAAREAALRSREAQLRSMLETVPDAMLVMDEAGRIREFSLAAEALWGYRSSDVVGQDFAMLAPESDRPRYRAVLDAFRADPRPPYAFIGRIVAGVGETADGRRFPIDIRVGLARTDEGPLFTVFFRDLSEQLANEERLGDLNAELAHVSRQNAMSELAADLAHELNQPLSASSNFLAAARMLLEEGRDIERAIELVRMAGDQTIRAGEIIRRLRAFTARREVDICAESIERAIRDAADLVMPGTRHFGIQIRYELDSRVTAMFADRVQVQQVMVNLLRNATDALRTSARTEREIVIATRPAPNAMVQIEVCDNGPGLSEATLSQLYTRFATSKGDGGMGIGLSISRRIIEAHGGTLTAENRVGGGACFRFTLPAMQEEIA